MHTFSAPLFALAASFTGEFAPYQGVLIAPMAKGIAIAATDRGASTIVCYDPNGRATDPDQQLVILPDKDLVAACRNNKTATGGRDLEISGDQAKVTTYFKSHSTNKEFNILHSSAPFPPLQPALAQVLHFWGQAPATGNTAGRYDIHLLANCIKAMADETSSIVLSAFHGGPLRIQREDTGVIVFLMPQTALPIPPLPDWLAEFSVLQPG